MRRTAGDTAATLTKKDITILKVMKNMFKLRHALLVQSTRRKHACHATYPQCEKCAYITIVIVMLKRYIAPEAPSSM